jgi:hypothetical protein
MVNEVTVALPSIVVEARLDRPDTLSVLRVAEVPEAAPKINVVIVALEPDAVVKTKVGITPNPVRVSLVPEALP